jgi:hypothetical protein
MPISTSPIKAGSAQHQHARNRDMRNSATLADASYFAGEDGKPGSQKEREREREEACVAVIHALARSTIDAVSRNRRRLQRSKRSRSWSLQLGTWHPGYSLDIHPFYATTMGLCENCGPRPDMPIAILGPLSPWVVMQSRFPTLYWHHCIFNMHGNGHKEWC